MLAFKTLSFNLTSWSLVSLCFFVTSVWPVTHGSRQKLKVRGRKRKKKRKLDFSHVCFTIMLFCPTQIKPAIVINRLLRRKKTKSGGQTLKMSFSFFCLYYIANQPSNLQNKKVEVLSYLPCVCMCMVYKVRGPF